MRKLINTISVSRIFFGVLMIFCFNNKLLLTSLLILCGLSDILDGYLARKFKLSSNLGAKIDTIADLIVFFIIIYLIIRLMNPYMIGQYLVYIFIILILRAISVLVVYIKYREFAFLHTILNKIAGLTIYISTIIFFMSGVENIYFIPIGISMIASIEEIMINLIKNKLNRDIKSILNT